MTRYHDEAASLAEAVVEAVGPRIVLALPLGLGKANHVANALYARAAADPSIHLTILTALTLEKPSGGNLLARRFIDPVIARLFGDYPELAYARALREEGLPPNVEVSEFFLMAGRWLDVPAMQRAYIPANYTHAERYVLARGVNVVAQLIAPSRDEGERRYSLSCNSDVTLDLLAARPDVMMVGQTNSELPYMPGEAELPAGAFAHILDSPQTDFSLFAPPRQPVGLSDHAAGLHVARLVPDGGTLQIGIGSLGDALAHALILRHRDNAAFRDLLARLGPVSPLGHMGAFDAGLYGLSEMLVEGFVRLADAGVLKREVDGALMHAAFFVGPKDFYRALREMPHAQRARFRMTGVSFVNQLYGGESEKARARVGARFVNNAMMATLQGAVVSDGLADGRVVSGVGGQYNFVAQAFALPDARAIITLPATRRSGGRTVSNIVWSYGHVTIPRHLRDIVVTEYGIADLRGTTDEEAIAAMLAIADSRFQDELLERAGRAGKIARDYRIPEAARRNTPSRIAEALGPAREAGLLPAFPFGSEFTATEQRLVPALVRLREADGAYGEMARLLLAGFKRPSAEAAECLDRMGLAVPQGMRERLYRRLLAGALAADEAVR